MVSNILIWDDEIGFIRINEGNGSNLFPEDEEQGYVDYIMLDGMIYDGYDLLEGSSEIESAQVMLTEMYQEMFKTPQDVIDYLIDAGWIPDIDYIVLYAE